MTSVTDAEGNYSFELPEGEYRLEIIAEGFNASEISISGETVPEAIMLEKAETEADEEIVQATEAAEKIA